MRSNSVNCFLNQQSNNKAQQNVILFNYFNKFINYLPNIIFRKLLDDFQITTCLYKSISANDFFLLNHIPRFTVRRFIPIGQIENSSTIFWNFRKFSLYTKFAKYKLLEYWWEFSIHNTVFNCTSTCVRALNIQSIILIYNRKVRIL